MLSKEVTAVNGMEETNNNTILYGPLTQYEFMRNFMDDEYFMVKLCHICDKANVPHHVVDDVVDLLRECKINNMHLQPEKLLK